MNRRPRAFNATPFVIAVLALAGHAAGHGGPVRSHTSKPVPEANGGASAGQGGSGLTDAADAEPVLGQALGRSGVASSDFDVDGDVDLDDYRILADCLNGPDVTTPPSDCDPADFANADLDVDLDVDLQDSAIFSQSFTGAFEVRSGQLCYLAGELAQIAVDVPLNTGDSLHFLVFEEDENGAGQLVFEQMLPLDGSPTYVFPVVLPNEIMYNAVARLLDPADTEIASRGLELGVRPDLPQIPAEICSFELATVDAFVLLEQVEQAAASQNPYVLEMGSRSFLVNLEENTAGLLSQDVQVQNPDIRLFRGTVIGNPDSGVRLSFRGEFPAMFVEASVDPAEDEASVYLEPAAEFEPGLPLAL
ncbi:MAG: hypothetical protein IID40_05135, partial [Planctomycetes bacterium]|nr:hypothetical protein [Planctomycetota bacterium]